MKNFLFAFLSFFFANILFGQGNTKPNVIQNTGSNNATSPTNSNNTNASQNPPANVPQTNTPYLKQKKEEITVEGILLLQFMNSPLGIKFEELKLRYFVTEKRAYRARGLVTMLNNNFTINDATTKKSASVIEAKQYLNLGIGIEEHLKSKNNISPYWGGEILLSFSNVKLDGTNTDDAQNYKEGYKIQSENTGYGFYIGAMAGLDYYLNTNFYIGTEIRYGYQSTNLGNVARTVLSPSGGIVSNDSGGSLGTNTKLEMNYTQGIRIGFKF